MKKNFNLIVLTGLVFIFSSLTLFSSTLSSIRGYVTDKETKSPLSKAKVTIVSQRSAAARFVLQTNKKGFYYKSGLQNGIYKVLFERDGYIPAGSSFRLKVGETFTADIKLEKIKKVQQDETASRAKRGIKFLQSGKYQKAIKELSEAIKINQTHFLLFYNRALAFEGVGNLESALADHLKSAELKPDFALSLASLGRLFAKQRNFLKAAEFYKKVYDSGSTDTVTMYNYAVCLINLGKIPSAQPVLEKLISLDPEYADAYYHLGIIYLGLENSTKAKEYLKKFIELDPKNSNVAVAREILKSLK